jgi:hypothetical protein
VFNTAQESLRTHSLPSSVETYLDPAWHEFAPPEMLDRRFRHKFVDACYERLGDARLIDFLEGVRPAHRHAPATIPQFALLN